MESLKERLLKSAAGQHWLLMGVQQQHGINIPLFSLHTEQSCGIGEYPDLLPLITWCKANKFNIIQLLPLNDTGGDVSPYNAISAFALNPIHIGLTALPFLDESPELFSIVGELKKLTQSQRVDYAQVSTLKDRFLRSYFQKVGERFASESQYQQFIASNAWLRGYALFKILKLEHQWKGWESWESPLQVCSADLLNQLAEKYKQDLSYHIFLQYLCFMQMHQAKEFAEQNEILLKGDIPILISRESADVWEHPHLFQLDYAAGAPPDMYAKEGQKWGFPIYNWEIMEKEGYAWWKARLHLATTYYHLYRLDHLVGFFRIWAIPKDAEPLKGHFIPQNEHSWIPQGEKIMRMMLETSPMFPIGEDLGTVPPEVRKCMDRLGICGTKVIRWERDWHKEGHPFIPYKDYNPVSMTTVSTHDSETLQQWWINQPEEAKAFAKFKQWDYMPQLSHQHHLEIIRDSHHTTSLFHINLLNEYLALVPGMTWPKLEDERINMPGIILETNWTYRFRPSLEQMIQSNELTTICAIIR